MLQQNSIGPDAGSKKGRMRIGRGNGSGKGTFCGRGVKGQGSRTGTGKFNASFEGGQTPLFRRMPKKRGFTAFNQVRFAVVNVSDLETLAKEGLASIDTAALIARGYLRDDKLPVKLLADGAIDSKVEIRVHKASKQAIEKIEKAGGKVEIIG